MAFYNDPATIKFVTIYFSVFLGIVISIILPILKNKLPTSRTNANLLLSELNLMNPYIIVGIFSLLTAFLLLVVGGNSIEDWRGALLCGYAWDSTLQKLDGRIR